MSFECYYTQCVLRLKKFSLWKKVRETQPMQSNSSREIWFDFLQRRFFFHIKLHKRRHMISVYDVNICTAINVVLWVKKKTHAYVSVTNSDTTLDELCICQSKRMERIITFIFICFLEITADNRARKPLLSRKNIYTS